LRENERRLRPELWRQKNWLLHLDNAVSHFLLHQRIFEQAQYKCRPDPDCFSLLPRFEIKLKRRNFDTVEVIEAESQAMLNTLTENRSQDAFKSAGNGVYECKGDYLQGGGGQ
jgi:hypothetical protein